MSHEHKNHRHEFVDPGPIGRCVRVVAGLNIVVALFLTSPAELADPDGLFWILAGIAFVVLPSAVGIIPREVSATYSRGAVLLSGGVLLAVDIALYHRMWAFPLAWLVYAVTVAVLGLWALSFVAAGLLGTPGCEWGGLPDLAARLRGRQRTPTECKAGLEALDRWEAGMWGPDE